MDSIIVFLATILISFTGSLQIGLVSLFVIRTTLNKSLWAGRFAALGCSLPESMYAILALVGFSFLEQNKHIFHIFEWVSIAILFVVGAVIILHKPKNKPAEQHEKMVNLSQNGMYILKGFSLAAVNPQLMIYWFLILIYFSGFEWFQIHSMLSQIAFALGTTTGAIMLLGGLVELTHKQKEKVLNYLVKYDVNKLFGIAIVSLAIFKLIYKLYNN